MASSVSLSTRWLADLFIYGPAQMSFPQGPWPHKLAEVVTACTTALPALSSLLSVLAALARVLASLFAGILWLAAVLPDLLSQQSSMPLPLVGCGFLLGSHCARFSDPLPRVHFDTREFWSDWNSPLRRWFALNRLQRLSAFDCLS